MWGFKLWDLVCILCVCEFCNVWLCVRVVFISVGLCIRGFLRCGYITCVFLRVWFCVLGVFNVCV